MLCNRRGSRHCPGTNEQSSKGQGDTDDRYTRARDPRDSAAGPFGAADRIRIAHGLGRRRFASTEFRQRYGERRCDHAADHERVVVFRARPDHCVGHRSARRRRFGCQCVRSRPGTRQRRRQQPQPLAGDRQWPHPRPLPHTRHTDGRSNQRSRRQQRAVGLRPRRIRQPATQRQCERPLQRHGGDRGQLQQRRLRRYRRHDRLVQLGFRRQHHEQPGQSEPHLCRRRQLPGHADGRRR